MNLSPLLIVLDLDETLIRATGNPSLDPPDFVLEGFRVRCRPALKEFFARIVAFADVGVWSSASDSYVKEIVERVVPKDVGLRFAWGRTRCTRRFDGEQKEEYWVKDLKKLRRLGYSLERVLIVDDSPEKVERHYGNHVPVAPFFGDLDDRVLDHLGIYLERFVQTPNVRTVEKRNWFRVTPSSSKLI